VLRDNNMDRIRNLAKYWAKMAQEPQWEIQEKWSKCKRRWTKINWAMRDIDFPEFGSAKDFFDLHEIVKQHAK